MVYMLSPVVTNIVFVVLLGKYPAACHVSDFGVSILISLRLAAG
jgi:hypothetical protein